MKANTETIREFLLRGEKEESFLISDVAEYGCSGGTINDLIYYEDTVKFHDEHEDEIWDELNTMSDDLGGTNGINDVNIPKLIGSFNGSEHVGSMTQFKNLLSWWVCEVIAQRIMDEREQDKEVA